MNSYAENPPVNNFGNKNAKNIIHYANFPKKYQRKWTDVIDARFGIIWLVTFVFHFSFALYFTFHPPTNEIAIADVNKIQKQYAALILKNAPDVKFDKKESRQVEENLDSASETDFTESQQEMVTNGRGSATLKFSEEQNEQSVPVDSRIKDYFSVRSSNRISNDKISEEVNSKGLLALLGNESEDVRGERARKLLGNAAGRQKNLKKVLRNVSGIQSSDNSQTGGTGKSVYRKAKGSRAQSNQEIEGLISGREQAVSTEVQRQGNFISEKVTAVKGDNNSVVGNRDPNEISVVINRHNAAIQSCYERGLKRDPDLKGKLVVRFTIAADGRVRNAKLISSTLNNSRVERCIVVKIRRWDDFGQIDSVLGDANVRQVYTFGY